MSKYPREEQQARNELENAERLGNPDSKVAAEKRLVALGVDLDAEAKHQEELRVRREHAAEKRAAESAEDEAPKGRTTRDDAKGSKA